ncbi:MAG: SDR family NAD(P)-dependent oxidoreductase [Burkholderiaceae bacterium]|nr:SDR family NAD(P)-dependent oxidoreductase [Burkholderiaceae bacterium]
MPAALIVGASRGIGLEFVRQYRAEGWNVTATHRDPAAGERLRALGATPIQVDVREDAQLARLGRTAAAAAPDLALVNAGVYGSRTTSLASVPQGDEFDSVMRTNVLAPMRLVAALAAPLAARGATLGFMSSRMGSIAETSAFNGALYRVSKTALNMVARLAHNEYGTKGLRVLSFHPGWVRTDMGGANADVEVRDSVAGLRAVIADPLRYPGGGFFDYRGAAIAW